MMSVFYILQNFDFKDADPIRSMLDVAEDRSFSLFLVPLKTNAVGVGRDNQTINIV